MNTDQHGLLHGEITEKILGVFFNVYNELGHGFLESVYEVAMCQALEEVGLTVECQVPVPVWFRGRQIGQFFADILVSKVVLLELKCVRKLETVHDAQLLHYLRATPIEVGLLLNFGPRAEFRRLLFDNPRKAIREIRENPWPRHE